MGDPARKSREGFDAHELAVRAVRVLDEEGLTALTMRRMAQEMGLATTSSLYWRVRSKDDLLRLAADEVYAEIVEAVRTGDDLRTVAMKSLGGLLKHPWSTQLLASHAAVGPGAAGYAELLLRSLASAGVPEGRRDAALAALGFYLMGAGQQLAAWRSAGSPADVPDHPAGSALGDYLSQASGDLAIHIEAGLDLILAAALRG